jgi:hypothetical protein
MDKTKVKLSTSRFFKYFILPWIIWGAIVIPPGYLVSEEFQIEHTFWTVTYGFIAILGFCATSLYGFVKSDAMKGNVKGNIWARFMFVVWILCTTTIISAMIWFLLNSP